MSPVARPTIAKQLAVVPVRNASVQVDDQGDAAVVTVDLRYPLLLRPLVPLLRMRQRKGYRLDGIGLAVWRRIDDRATLAELVDWFATEHRLSFHESRALLLGYLQTLVNNGLVVLAGLNPAS
jgi:hypothetical protein